MSDEEFSKISYAEAAERARHFIERKRRQGNSQFIEYMKVAEYSDLNDQEVADGDYELAKSSEGYSKPAI